MSPVSANEPTPDSFSMPSGVGPVTASAKKPFSKMGWACGQVVMAVGNDTSMNTRPTKAGLKGFLPKPPKAILPTPMATMLPTMAIQMGRLAGTLKARSKPVSAAEPSLMVKGPLMRNFWISHSVSIQAAIETMVSLSAYQPK